MLKNLKRRISAFMYLFKFKFIKGECRHLCTRCEFACADLNKENFHCDLFTMYQWLKEEW